jgi:putative transposase
MRVMPQGGTVCAPHPGSAADCQLTRVKSARPPIAVPDGPNQRWSLDFVSDSMSDGRRFRMLCVVDDCTRECLGLVADTSLSGLRVASELDAIVSVRGLPLTVVSDNGTELTSTAILRWSQERGVGWHYIGKRPVVPSL